MRSAWRLAAIAAAAGVLALPTTASAGGAQHFTESWTETVHVFQPNACLEMQVTGTGVQSGTDTITATDNGTFHVVGRFDGSIDLYEALGPGPWDPQPGAYVGTWTYNGTFEDQVTPTGDGATNGTSHGWFTFADGSRAILNAEFHLTWRDGTPSVFFAHFTCGGTGSFTG